MRVASPAAAEALLAEGGALRFQLHETAHGPACCLTLAPAEGDPIVWPTEDAALVDHLARRFAVTIEAIDPQGALVARRVFDPPLARNVALARERAQALGGETAAARAALAAGAVDVLGELRHNFREDTFARLRTAAEAQLALGITAFWAEPERARYLLLVQSFPAVWFDAIVRRVLVAALEFGLLPPPHLEAWAIEHGVVADAHRLLRRALAGFAELELGLAGRTSDLDPLDAWENWERLLTRAEALGVDVDPQVEALAMRAMEAARLAAEAEEGSEELIELDPEDAIDVESVDLSMGEGSAADDGAAEDPDGRFADRGVDDRGFDDADLDDADLDDADLDDANLDDADLDDADLDDPDLDDRLDDRDPLAALADRGDAVLLGLLDDRTQRAAAAAVLLRRGEALYAPTLADALAAMEPAELLRALPAALPLASALAPHLRDALHDGRPAVRRALALFFAEAGLADGDDPPSASAPFAARLAAALELDDANRARSKGDATGGFE
ncbi:MAG: pentapeptide repeat-containing protein [Myxococcales bacterium]|nr:pentapeptide repeat-containing protein [Myxococcales bacterium]